MKKGTGGGALAREAAASRAGGEAGKSARPPCRLNSARVVGLSVRGILRRAVPPPPRGPPPPPPKPPPQNQPTINPPPPPRVFWGGAGPPRPSGRPRENNRHPKAAPTPAPQS